MSFTIFKISFNIKIKGKNKKPKYLTIIIFLFNRQKIVEYLFMK